MASPGRLARLPRLGFWPAMSCRFRGCSAMVSCPRPAAACRGRWSPGSSPVTSGPAGPTWIPRRAGNFTARLADGCRVCTPPGGSPALAPGRGTGRPRWLGTCWPGPGPSAPKRSAWTVSRQRWCAAPARDWTGSSLPSGTPAGCGKVWRDILEPMQLLSKAFEGAGRITGADRPVLDPLCRGQLAALERGQDRPPVRRAVGVQEQAQPGRQVWRQVESCPESCSGGASGTNVQAAAARSATVDRLSGVPVDEADRHAVPVNGVPGAEVAVRDDLPGCGRIGVEAVAGDRKPAAWCSLRISCAARRRAGREGSQLWAGTCGSRRGAERRYSNRRRDQGPWGSGRAGVPGSPAGR